MLQMAEMSMQILHQDEYQTNQIVSFGNQSVLFSFLMKGSVGAEATQNCAKRNIYRVYRGI